MSDQVFDKTVRGGKYKEVKLVYFGDYAGVRISGSPTVYEYPNYSKCLETYLKDGWSVISFTAHTATDCYTFLLGR